jgi:hypothetical protein
VEFCKAAKMAWEMLREIGLMSFVIGALGLCVSKLLARPLGGADVEVLAILGDRTMFFGASLAFFAMAFGYLA